MSNVELKTSTALTPKNTMVAVVTVPENAISAGSGQKLFDMLDAYGDAHRKIEKEVAKNEKRRDETQAFATEVLIRAMLAHPPLADLTIEVAKAAGSEGAKKRQELLNDACKAVLDMGKFETDNESGKTVFVESAATKERFGVLAPKGSTAYTKGADARRNYATFVKKAQSQALGAIILKFEDDENSISIDPTTKHLMVTGPAVREVFKVDQESILLDGKKPEGVEGELPVDNSLKGLRDAAAQAYKAKPASAPAVTSTETGVVPAGGNTEESVRTLCAQITFLMNKLNFACDEDTSTSLRGLETHIGDFFVGKREKDNAFAETTKRQATQAKPPQPAKAQAAKR